MTGSAVSEFGALLLKQRRDSRIIIWIVLCIVFGAGFMTIKTPTHVQYLGVLINRHFADISMTVLAIQTRRNVRAMCEMHKVWHLSYMHPNYRCVVCDRIA